MTPRDLRSAGLDTKEAATYLAVLELGEASMGSLVKKSRLKRTTLYDITETLKERGLIGVSRRGKRAVYTAENPNKLIEQADENKRRLENLLPELLSITNTITKKPKMRYFEGVEGIKEVYRDVLRYPNYKTQAWVPENIIYELDTGFFDDYYTPKLREQNRAIELIATDLPIFRHHKKANTIPSRKIKLVDATHFPFTVEICLYGMDRIAIMSYRDQMGLIIESESIARTLKSVFELQWELLGD